MLATLITLCLQAEPVPPQLSVTALVGAAVVDRQRGSARPGFAAGARAGLEVPLLERFRFAPELEVRFDARPLRVDVTGAARFGMVTRWLVTSLKLGYGASTEGQSPAHLFVIGMAVSVPVGPWNFGVETDSVFRLTLVDATTIRALALISYSIPLR